VHSGLCFNAFFDLGEEIAVDEDEGEGSSCTCTLIIDFIGVLLGLVSWLVLVRYSFVA
jgi:hypothetical protein